MSIRGGLMPDQRVRAWLDRCAVTVADLSRDLIGLVDETRHRRPRLVREAAVAAFPDDLARQRRQGDQRLPVGVIDLDRRLQEIAGKPGSGLAAG